MINHRKRMLLRSILVVLLTLIVVGSKREEVLAETKKHYGILIANEEGAYQFYDLNLPSSNQAIEQTKSGKVMIPLRKVCAYLPGISYQFDFAKNQATVVNEATGKRMVLTVGKKTAVLYDKKNKKKTVKLAEKCYTSKDSKALMVPMASLASLCAKENGYRYYGNKEIRKAQYDCSLYQGILVYNMKKAVKSLPKATKVQYVNQNVKDAVVKVTIPEGYSVAQIIDSLVKNGVCVSSAAVYQAMEQVDYNQYSMFQGRQVNENVCFPLEGYLYPDTYEFYKNSDPLMVLNKLLKHSDRMLSTYKEQAQELGYSFDQILILASIIEKEAREYEDRLKVSGVFANRLKQGMRLQSDATIHYIERYVKPNITGDIDRYNKWYNTYKCKGLPAGPICNPGSKAIYTAMNPTEHEYLYFASDESGTFYFSETYEQHLAIWEEIKEKKEN